MRGKTVLVTGGAGFIGSHLVDLLIKEEPREIRVIDNMIRGRVENLAEALPSSRVRLVEGDIRDRALLRGLVEDADLVFHLAALRITQCAEEPREAIEVMIDATFDLVDMCRISGVERLVAASTASVYGLAEAFPTPESAHPYANRTLYGAAKLFNEGLLRAFNESFGLRYAAFRYFNVYGPRMDIHGRYTEVLVRWMERIAAGSSPVIFGDGNQTMDFIDVRDVARATLLGAKLDVNDEVFNVGMGEEVSLQVLAETLLRVMGRPELGVQHAAARSINPVPRRLADVRKAEKLLGFRAAIGLAQGLSDLVAWWRAERRLVQP